MTAQFPALNIESKVLGFLGAVAMVFTVATTSLAMGDMEKASKDSGVKTGSGMTAQPCTKAQDKVTGSKDFKSPAQSDNAESNKNTETSDDEVDWSLA